MPELTSANRLLKHSLRDKLANAAAASTKDVGRSFDNGLQLGDGIGGQNTQVLSKSITLHPGVELRLIPKSISRRRHLFEMAFAWESTKETIC